MNPWDKKMMELEKLYSEKLNKENYYKQIEEKVHKLIEYNRLKEKAMEMMEYEKAIRLQEQAMKQTKNALYGMTQEQIEELMETMMGMKRKPKTPIETLEKFLKDSGYESK